MRKAILLIIVFTLFSIHTFCQPTQLIPVDSLKSLISGEWIWVRSFGGFTGDDEITPEDLGITRSLVFQENDTLLTIENGEIQEKNEYIVSHELSNIYADTVNYLKIKYEIQAPDTQLIRYNRYYIEKLNTDTLLIVDDMPDGYGYYYVRNHILSAPSHQNWKNELVLFPSPCNSSSFLNLEVREPIISISIFRMNGQLLGQYEGNFTKLDISYLKNGLYFIGIVTPTKTITKELWVE